MNRLKREIKELEDLTEEIVRYEIENGLDRGEAFQDYEEAFDNLYQILEGFGNYDGEHEDFEQLLDNAGITDFDDQRERLTKLKDRMDVYRSSSYDEIELMTRYILEEENSEGSITTTDCRDSDIMPSPNIYYKRIGKFTNARWRVGSEGHEKLGSDLILEKLNDTIHKLNEGKPIDEYEIPTGPELDEIETAPSTSAFLKDDDIGGYENALEMLGFLELRDFDTEDEKGRWQKKLKTGDLSEAVEDFLIRDQEFGTYFMNTENYVFLEELKEVAESDKRTSVKAETQQEGRFYKALDSIGVLGSWGAGTRYIVKGEVDDFRKIRREIAVRTGEENIVPREVEFTNMLRRASALEGKTLTVNETNSHPDTPHVGSYFEYLGSYNNAVASTGLEPNHENRPDEELEAALIDVYQSLERRPEPKEIEKMTGISRDIFENRHGGGLEGMMDDLDIPSFDDELGDLFNLVFDNTYSSSALSD